MILRALAVSLLLGFLDAGQAALPEPAAIDAQIQKVMAETGSKGLAIAVIDEGKVKYVQAYGVRNAKGDPLQTDTVMYGASLTKAVVAYATLQLVDAGKIALDTPIADDLEQPLPSYGPIRSSPTNMRIIRIWRVTSAGAKSRREWS